MNSTTSTDSRRNSFSSFVKNLILLVSPSTNNNEDELNLERKSSTTSSENSPFQDLYFSFPAFEETYEDSTTVSNCGHAQTYMTQTSSSIMC
jgi:hypothetical protein